ncbi:MAG: sugar-binding protein [Victivallaceae bacterium]|nr:sugar-binding protein [Victivallaceae bacterium]
MNRKLFLGALLLSAGLAPLLHAEDRLIIEDFSDVGTWRTAPLANITPGKWFSADLELGATPDGSRDDKYAGKIRFHAADSKKPVLIDFQRFKAYLPEVFLRAVEFDADPRGISCEFRATIEDAAGKRFSTKPQRISGNNWQRVRLEFAPPKEATPPYKFHKLHFRADQVAGENFVLIDDIALVGDASRKRRVSIRPVAEARLISAPGKEIARTYRFRNAGDKPLLGEVRCEVIDYDGRKVFEKKASLSLPAGNRPVHSQWMLPALPEGCYRVQIDFQSGKLATSFFDTVAVGRANMGRKNSVPMWFGVQDTSIWNGEGENALHSHWLREAGFDIERVGLTGGRFEDGTSENYAGVEKFLRANRDNGMIACLSYSEGAPAYTREPGSHSRQVPTREKEFSAHMKKVFECIGKYPSVRYLEFLNEPDIGFMVGTTEQYLAALKVVFEQGRAVAPRIKITTGGVTVLHPREKKNFSRDMYLKGKPYFDIACFHAHGGLPEYETRQKMVESWLAAGGIDRPVCNTETGERSGYDNWTELRRQATTLVRKLIYAKSRNTEFYIWFTLQDYWDMDFNADDSFGLITSENRPKPSYAAYNTLIAALGNTQRGKKIDDPEGRQIYEFIGTQESPRQVYAVIPGNDGEESYFALSGKGEIVACDMFGKALAVQQIGNVALVPVTGKTTYVTIRNGRMTPSPAPAGLRKIVGGAAGSLVSVPVELRNIFDHTAQATLDGMAPVTLPPGATRVVMVKRSIPAGQPNGIWATTGRVRWLCDGKTYDLSLPFSINVCYPVAAGTRPGNFLKLNALRNVSELSFDPMIPRWMGPDDLSCSLGMAHQNQSLSVELTVRDNRHVMNSTAGDAWKDDSLQIAFEFGGKHTELTVSGDGKGPGRIYAHITPDKKRIGQWNDPCTVTRKGSETIYRWSVPLEKLGIPSTSGTIFRFNFLINENDGSGRVRYLEWQGGIGKNKNPNAFGWGVLE